MHAYANYVVGHLFTQGWQIAILAGIVGVISFALRSRSAHLRYLLWLIVLAKCFVPPFLSIPLAILPERPGPAPSVALAELPDGHSAFEAPVLTGTVPRPAQLEPAKPDTQELVALVWTAGVCLFLLWVGCRAVRYTSWLRVRRRPLPTALSEFVRELSAGFRFKMRPRAWLLEDVSQPFVWGLLRGSVYLPADFASSSGSDRQRSVLTHELSHVARFDAGVNLLQILAQATYWFHPFVWWANRRIRQEREKCCDEMAVAHLHTPPEQYTGAIVDALAVERRSAHPVSSLAIVSSVRDIEERIRTMLRPGRTFRRHPSFVAAAAALFVAVVTIPTALVLTARGQAQLTAHRYTARTFGSELELDVIVEQTGEDTWFDAFVPETPSDEVKYIGSTPEANPIEIPSCALWFVQPATPVENWDLLLQEMNRNRVPGLRLAGATDSDLQHLAAFARLEYLNLANYTSRTNIGVTDAGMAHLRGLAGLWRLDLLRNQVTGPGLEHLKDLPQLEWLDLAANPLTNAGLAHLRGLRGLRHMDIGGTAITDAGLEHVEGMSELETLGVDTTAIGDAGLAHLRNLTRLTELSLDGTKVTDAGLEHLKGLTGLQQLDLSYDQIVGPGLAHLRSLTKLKGLGLTHTQVTDSGLAHLEGLTGLSELPLEGTGTTNVGLEHLSRLTELQRLGLAGTRVTDAGLAHLAGLSKLQRLDLSGTQVGNAGMEDLKGLTKLESLNLSRTRVTDAGLEHLLGLTRLTSLTLNRTQVTDAGLAHLGALVGLRKLELSNTRIGDASLEHLKDLTKLEWLNIEGTRVTDAGLEHIAGLTGLKWLALRDNQVTDAGIAHLKGLSKLWTLNLDGTGITDAGLEHLRGLLLLKNVYLSSTRVTDAGVRQLQQRLPELAIIRGRTFPTTQDAGEPTQRLNQAPATGPSTEELARSRYAARTFNSKLAFDVIVQETRSGERASIGHTPSATTLEIPACYLWWVQPAEPVDDWGSVAREIDQNQIPGLRLASATDSELGHLRDLTRLRSLYCSVEKVNRQCGS